MTGILIYIAQLEPIVLFSFIFSLTAIGLSLVRILKSQKESKRKRQSDLFLNVTNLIRLLEDEKFIQSRSALRKNKLLIQLKDGNYKNDNENDNLIFETASTVSNTGLSAGITTMNLDAISKLILSFNMIMGRFEIIVILYIFISKLRR